MSNLGFSPLLPDIQKEFSMSHTQIGLFTGMYGLLALVLSVPAGLVAKRYGEKRMLVVALFLVGFGLFMLGRAPGFFTAFASRALWIGAYRFAFVGVLTAIAITSPPSLKGSSMGLLGSVSSLATVIGAPFGSKIGEGFRMAHRDDRIRMRSNSGGPGHLGILSPAIGGREDGCRCTLLAVPGRADGAHSARRLSGLLLHWWEWSEWLPIV